MPSLETWTIVLEEVICMSHVCAPVLKSKPPPPWLATPRCPHTLLHFVCHERYHAYKKSQPLFLVNAVLPHLTQFPHLLCRRPVILS